MARPVRRDSIIEGGIYHVYARGNDGMALFRDKGDYRHYLDAVGELRAAHGVSVHHFALMPNHVHFLITAGPDLSLFMQTTQTRFAKYFCKKYTFKGHVWQGRFKTKPIETDSYLFACGNYIEMNPVRANLVLSPSDWPHSSYSYYAHGTPSTLIKEDPFYAELGTSADERRTAYRRLVAQTRMSVPLVSGTQPRSHA